jgi:hypothetical protein
LWSELSLFRGALAVYRVMIPKRVRFTFVVKLQASFMRVILPRR